MVQEIRNETGTQRLVGYVVEVGVEEGSARCWLDLDERHLNRHNVLHGGIATILLDNACGTTGSLTVDRTGLAPFLSVSLNVQFLAPGLPGRVTATGKITGGGRSLKFISGELRHEDGTLIAISNGVFKRVPQEKLT
ncbi:MAG: PaaI family thioesterase [Planktotalea sp.]|uniref:PaaI family thioesterase n=1 Tax=Planktotalea sp. TaxID=2029877 RepID=UPI003C74ABD9